MKVLKIIAAIVVTLLVLVAIAIALALTPAIQTWAVRKAVAGQPGLTLDVSRVAAGFSSAALDDVHLVKDGIVVTARHVTAKYAAWDFVFHRRVTVDDLTADQLTIDLRQPAASPAPNSPGATAPTPPARATPASAPFSGVLNQLQLPVDVQIARFSIPGQALLPNQQTVNFEVHGSNIATGQKGTVDWKADLTNPQPTAPIRALHSTGTANLHLTTERRIDVVDINALASAEGAGLPTDQFRLEANAEQPGAGGNEGYNAKLLMVHGSNAAPLLTIAAHYDAATHEIGGAWNVTVQRDQLAALLNGLGLPEVAASGAGNFTTQPETGAVVANGELHGDIQHLEKISPELATIGALHFQTNFDGGLSDHTAHLEQFTWEATAADGRRIAEIRALQRVAFSLADKRVSFGDAKADLARITVQSLPLAWAQPFVKGFAIDSGDLSLVLAVAAEADGSHVRVTAPEPLALHNVTVRQGTQKVLDRLNLTVRPRLEYSADRLHAELPDLDAAMPTGDALRGSIAADVTHLSGARTIAFTAQTEAKVVTVLKPYLPDDAGPLVVGTRSKGTMTGDILRFEESRSTVARLTGAPLLEFELLQPLAVDMAHGSIEAAKSDTVTARLKLAGIPLAWANKLAPGTQAAGQVTAGTLDLTIRAADDVTVTSSTPLALRGVSLALNHQPMLANVDLAADFTGAKHGDAVSYDVRRFQATAGNASLAKLAVTGNATLGPKPAYSAKGTLEADAAALAQQPAMASYASLARGTVSATFDAKIADTIQANAAVTAQNLVAKADNRPLGDAELKVTASVQADGSSTVKVPFLLSNGNRKSDLLIDGKIARTGNLVSFEGQLTSSQLFVEDLQPLAALAPTAKPAAASAPAPSAIPGGSNAAATAARPATPVTAGTGTTATPVATPGRDLQPFWNGVSGRFAVDLKQITVRPDDVINGIRGSAAITPTQLALTSLEGKFKDQPFKVGATITFDPKLAEPYALDAAANFANIDIGAILQAANPKERPAIETSVTIDGKVQGHGANLPDLLQHATGKFDVNGSKGVLRALARKGGAAGTAASAGSALLGMLGGAVADRSQGAAAILDLTRKLAELPFDSFAMHAERGADLNLNVTRIEFLSADTRLTGGGTITNQPGVPIQNQPMRFTLQLAGKDDMAVILDRVHLLNGQQDDRGYQQMFTTFNVTGTPANPNANDYWRIALQGTLRNLGGILGR
jgi:hypothetical protein